VVLRYDAFGMVHAAHGHVELLGTGVQLEGERGSAAPAERALGPLRGRDPCRRARDKREVGAPDARPGHERRGGKPPGDRAVTVRDVVRRAGRAPAYHTAEAPPGPGLLRAHASLLANARSTHRR